MRIPFINKSEKKYDLVFKIIILLITGLFIVLNIIGQFQKIIYKPFLISFCVTICYIAVLFLASKFLSSEKIALIVVCLISLVILVAWNILYRPTPISDYKYIWDGAHQILDGSFYENISDKSNYFSFYSFQIGFAYYCSIFLRIYDSLITLKIIEIITLAAISIVLFCTLRLSNNIQISFFGASLFASYPYIFVGSGIINNQHIGLLLGSISVYIILRSEKYIAYVISAIILVIGNVLRPSTLMIFASIVLLLFIKGFTNKIIWIKMLIFVVLFFFAYEIIDKLFIILSLAPYGIKNSDLYFKLILGLTGGGLTAKGGTGRWYIFEDLQYYSFDYQKYRDACRNYLKDTIIGGKIDLSYIFGKINWYISGIDNQTSYSDFKFCWNHGFWMDCFNCSGMIIYIISLIGSFFNILKQNVLLKNSRIFLPAIIFCLYFGIYCIFEAMPRYRFEQYYFLFILSMPYIYSQINNCIVLLNRKKLLNR